MKEQESNYTPLGTRDKELNNILAETSQGKSIMMQVAKKIKFRERVSQFSKAMQVISGSTLAASVVAGFSGLTQSNPMELALTGSDGSVIGAGIVLSGIAMMASGKISDFAKDKLQPHNVSKMARNEMFKSLQKSIKEEPTKAEHYDTSYLKSKLYPVVAAADYFTKQVKQINDKSKQNDGLSMAM